MKRDKDDHTVEYTPIDYHCLGYTQKERVKERQAQGIATPYDPTSTSEESQGKVAEKYFGVIRFL